MAGMDVLVLNERVDQISFGTASHFANMGSWKAGSPTSSPLLLKAQSRQQFIGLQQSHGTTESTITALQQILEATTPWPNPLLLCIRHVFSTFFCSCNEGMGMMQPQRNAELANALPLSGTQASGREWRLRFHKRIKRHGFLGQTCRTNLFSAVRCILRTWAAERLAAPLPTHCC